MLIRVMIFLVLFTVIQLILGYRLLSLLGWDNSICGAYALGLTSLFAVFQFIAYPLYRLNSSFSLLFWSFFVTLMIILLISIATLRFSSIQETCKDCRIKISTLLETKISFLLLLINILLLYFMGLGFYYSSSDDGYNIPRALETLAQNSLGVNDTLAWRGIDVGAIISYENASTAYFFVAFLSKVSGIHVTVLSKTVFLITLITSHIAAVNYAYDCTSESNNPYKKQVFQIFYILFQLFCVKPSSAGTWITGFLYEGKATMIAVIFPLMLASCAQLIRRIDFCRLREWLVIALLLTAGIELSVVGIFLPVILYFCFGTAFLLGTKFYYFKKTLFPVFLSLLPTIIYGLLSVLGANSAYLQLGGLSTYMEGSESSLVPSNVVAFFSSEWLNILFRTWKVHFLEAIDFWQFILYLIGVIYFLKKGTRIQKILFCFTPFILLVTFLNPLLADLVSAYITTPIVYWRLWWLLPIYLCPALALSDFLDHLTDGKPQNALFSGVLALGIISGYEVFRNSIVSPEYTIIPFTTNVGKLFNVRPELRFNEYNLNPGPLETAKAILSDWDNDNRPHVFMCFNRPFELRQYSEEITLVTDVRNYEQLRGTIGETDILLRDFAENYSSIADGELLYSLLSTLQTDYVCFDQCSAVINLEEFGFRHIQDYAGISLWRVLP